MLEDFTKDLSDSYARHKDLHALIIKKYTYGLDLQELRTFRELLELNHEKGMAGGRLSDFIGFSAHLFASPIETFKGIYYARCLSKE